MPDSKTLIIVESPAKAKTISRFLGRGYVVEASFGHVRDLPNGAAEIPAKYKGKEWARLGVDVDKDFEPLYVIPADKKKRIAKLKEAMDGADTVLLATDEDREGESISWHITQVAPPKKGAEVRRIVFHEVTREAIEQALREPRDLNESLVRAQEARRILDRLFGYTLSPLLWKKVVPRLSAGRVQSVAVKLAVDRERQRIAFRSATYWDLLADLKAEGGEFSARLAIVGEQDLADGKSFDPNTGELKNKKHLVLDESGAKDLASSSAKARPWTVTSLEQSPGEQRPHPPFTTSTLQQEANRKLRFPAKRTMQIAQQLYEGVDLGGERVGLITYMRTDSVTLAERALQQAREVIGNMYGKDYLPPSPIRYKTKSKGAQEAHEAIRPTDLARRPQDVEQYLDDDQRKIYDLIWKRTIASQMLPARFTRTNVEITVDNLVFKASGKQIVFPGFLRAYVEGSDDPEAELEDQESILPPLKKGETVEPKSVTAESHTTKPPARYTEASLVKKLEEEGIGRPSTYASIITTIQDRGYIFKRANELVPTFTAFAVTQLLEKHFEDLVSLKFTAHMEDELDDVAEGKSKWTDTLREFYFGKENNGLKKRVQTEEKRADFPRVEIGDGIVVKIGKYGPYLQRGEGGEGNLASIPDEIAPAELTVERAISLIEDKNTAPVSLGEYDGRAISLMKGRFGDYLQIAAKNGDKQRNVSLPKGMKPEDVTEDIAQQLASLPRTIGDKDGKKITSAIGKFGPYVKWGDDFRSLENWEQTCTLSLDEALEIFSKPKGERRRKAPEVIQDFGEFKVLSGRYGPYVSDGETNATLPKGSAPDKITKEEALQVLEAKRAAGPSKKRRMTKKTTKKASPRKRAG